MDIGFFYITNFLEDCNKSNTIPNRVTPISKRPFYKSTVIPKLR